MCFIKLIILLLSLILFLRLEISLSTNTKMSRNWFGYDIDRVVELMRKESISDQELIYITWLVKSRGVFDCSPLHLQTKGNVITALIKAGALVYGSSSDEFKSYVNVRDDLNNTPLHYFKDSIAIRALIEAGADVHAVNDSGRTPLNSLDVRNVYKEMMTERLQRFCKLNFRYFVFKHWIESEEGNRWLFDPKRGGKYVERRMLQKLIKH